MKITINIKLNSEDMDSSSIDELNPVEQFKQLEKEVKLVDKMFKDIEEQVEVLKEKIRCEGFYPARTDIEAWCIEKGLEAPFSLKDWFSTVMKEAVSTNLEKRLIDFGDRPVPWANGSITIFDLIRGIPEWLKISSIESKDSNNCMIEDETMGQEDNMIE